MTTVDIKAIARRFYDLVWNQGNMDVAAELLTPDVVDHAAPAGFPSGLEGVKRVFGLYRGAFPDLHVTVEDMIAEGDKVVARWTTRGTHQGGLMGIPPSGKPVTISGIDLFRFAGDKIVEHWAEFDMLWMMQQIGVIPPPS